MTRGEQMFWMCTWGGLGIGVFNAFIVRAYSWPAAIPTVLGCFLIGLVLWGVERLFARRRSDKLLIERNDTPDD